MCSVSGTAISLQGEREQFQVAQLTVQLTVQPTVMKVPVPLGAEVQVPPGAVQVQQVQHEVPAAGQAAQQEVKGVTLEVGLGVRAQPEVHHIVQPAVIEVGQGQAVGTEVGPEAPPTVKEVGQLVQPEAGQEVNLEVQLVVGLEVQGQGHIVQLAVREVEEAGDLCFRYLCVTLML